MSQNPNSFAPRIDLASYELFFSKSQLAKRAIRRRHRADRFWQLSRMKQRLIGGRYMGLILELMADMAREEYVNEQQ